MSGSFLKQKFCLGEAGVYDECYHFCGHHFVVLVFLLYFFGVLHSFIWGVGGGQCSGTVFIFINSVEKYLQIFLYWNVSWD